MIKRLLVLVAVLMMAGIAVPKANSEQNYNIKQMTPQVESALESRRDRYDKLTELKAKGIIGEDNKGYVKILKDDPQAQELVNAENKDRKIIYKTIAEQNDLSGQIGTIEKVFAQVQREKALPGEMIQTEQGDWVKK